MTTTNFDRELDIIRIELNFSAYVMRRDNNADVDKFFARKRWELLKERALIMRLKGENK